MFWNIKRKILDVTLWLKADAMNEHPECVIKDTPEEAIGLENVNGPLTRLSTTTTKLSLRHGRRKTMPPARW
ncbi:hypothetical protein MUTS16_61740 [Escherichia coli]|nr:hypothetical protein MUTS16_61740 [Escherichia coli]